MTATTGPIVAYVPDLMDRSKVDAAAVAVGRTVVRVGRPDDLAGALADAGPAALVVVDLGRPGVLEALGPVTAAGATVIGFASHVERDLAAAARAAGVTQVLARSAFFAGLPELLAP